MEATRAEPHEARAGLRRPESHPVAAPETGDLLAIEGEVHEAMSEDLDHDLLVGVEDEGAVEQHVG